MPIQTNFATCVYLYHVPLPGDPADAEAINAAFAQEQLKRGRIKAELDEGGIRLKMLTPFPLEALGDDFWQEVGTLIARSGELWWDFCATVVDAEPQSSHPHAHALSLHRVTASGEMRYLHHEAE